METKKRTVNHTLADIPIEKDGFLHPGMVVRYYRNKKGWTQEQLASKLGITTLMVHKMEAQKKGLDSLERRRLLCTLLGIPPIVLGLGSAEQLKKFLQAPTAIDTTPTIVLRDNAPTVEKYRTVLVEYNHTNFTLSGASLISEIKTIIPVLYQQIKNTDDRQEKKSLLYVLWEFHRLAAKVHTDFHNDVAATLRHLDEAVAISNELNDFNLVAIAHAHVAAIRMLEQMPHLAKADIEAALTQLKNASSIVQCDVYGLAARVYHSSSLDLGDITKSRYFLDRSGNLMKNVSQDDRYIPMGLHIVRCELTHIESLIATKHSTLALEHVEKTENVTPQDHKRTIAVLLRDKAECYLQAGYPEYSLDLILQSYGLSKSLNDVKNLDWLRRIYQQIKTGLDKNNRAVLDFEEQLLQL